MKKSKTEPLHQFDDGDNDDNDEYKQKSLQSQYYGFIDCHMRD